MTNEHSTPIGIPCPLQHPKNPHSPLQQTTNISYPSLSYDPNSYDDDDDDFGLSNLQTSFSSDDDDDVFERVGSDEDSDWDDPNFAPYDDNDEDDEDDSYDDGSDESQPVPHWFAHEDSAHVEAIFQQYTEKLISSKDFMRSHQPFVGRIRRQASHTQGDFQTVDEVEICNCQRVKAEARIPSIKTLFVVTSWDVDGIPYSFFTLETQEQLCMWENRIRNDVPASYLYCFPDWFNQAEASRTTFVYKSSLESLCVTYANVPWERTAYHCIARNNQLPLRSSSGEWDETFGSPPAF